MNNDVQKIKRYFPTEKQNKFHFPNRPFTTVSISLILLGIFTMFNLPSISLILILGLLAFDNIILGPMIKGLKAVNNLLINRKSLKSIVVLVSLALSILAGTLLTFLVFSNIPVFIFGIAVLTLGYGFSPSLIALGGIIGLCASLFKSKMTPYFGLIIGMVIGFMVGFFFPLLGVPLLIEAAFMLSMAIAVVSQVIITQMFRLHHYLVYGHSNADTYGLDCPEEELEQFTQKQSKMFEVSKIQFLNLTDALKLKIQKIKLNSTYFEYLFSTTSHQVNAYKDIYHNLMNPNLTNQDITATRRLLLYTKYPNFSSEQKDLYPFFFSSYRHTDFRRRMAFHQQQISETNGIEDCYIDPFIEVEERDEDLIHNISLSI